MASAVPTPARVIQAPASSSSVVLPKLFWKGLSWKAAAPGAAAGKKDDASKATLWAAIAAAEEADADRQGKVGEGALLSVDGAALEIMFGKAKAEKGGKGGDEGVGGGGGGGVGGGGGGDKQGASDGKVRKVDLLDGRRQQNVGIALQRFLHQGLNPAEICRGIMQLDDDTMSADNAQNVLNLLPTPDEVGVIDSYVQENGTDRLGDVEKFFMAVNGVPRIQQRLECIGFRQTFGDSVSVVRGSLEVLSSATAIIRRNVDGAGDGARNGAGRPLARLMAFILRVGNYLNGGEKSGQRGMAWGFQLGDLTKLSKVKTGNGKRNLLMFVQQFAQAEGSSSTASRGGAEEEGGGDGVVTHTLWDELMRNLIIPAKRCLPEASTVELGFIRGEVANLGRRTRRLRAEVGRFEEDLAKCVAGGDGGDKKEEKALRRFVDVMGPCADKAEAELASLVKTLERVEGDGSTIITYFAHDPKKVRRRRGTRGVSVHFTRRIRRICVACIVDFRLTPIFTTLTSPLATSFHLRRPPPPSTPPSTTLLSFPARSALLSSIVFFRPSCTRSLA